jgi:hypothetical protein
MKFTIPPATLDSLMENAGVTKPKKSDVFTLSATGGRVSVEFHGEISAIIAPIRSEGAVKLITKNFRAMLDTYKRTPELTFEAGPDGLKINNLKIPIQEWIVNPPNIYQKRITRQHLSSCHSHGNNAGLLKDIPQQKALFLDDST